MADSAAPTVAAYRLDLTVDVPAGRWSGTAEIDLASTGPTAALDAEDLEIRSVRDRAGPVPFEHDRSAHRLCVPVRPRETETLTVAFSGRVVEGALVGLYRSRHGSGSALLTQLEPVGARRVFPCVDRPDRKAPLGLRVRTDPALTVVSNAPVESIRDVGGLREWTFAPSVPLATYLFFLAVGRFDAVEDRNGRVPLRLLAPPGRARHGAPSLAAARRLLAAYEEYYGIPYPLPKLDLVAVEELACGAMENFGAICFRDMRLLLDESSTALDREQTFATISHEIAHQWFGNLVTLSDWNEIWLNESFASFLAPKIAEQVDPDFPGRSAFILHVAGMAAALEGDSLRSTHPVRAAVSSPDEINQIFDEISYGKGSAVLAMLEGYLGAERFRLGVSRYLSRHAGGNARTTDLWGALTETSGEPVATMLDPWLDRPGLPVVRAAADGDRLRLTQGRFAYDGPFEATTWPIPLVTDIGGVRSRHRFEGPALDLPLPPRTVVHLNPGAVGFYRVRYDDTLLERLRPTLPTRPAADRWIVLEDLAALLTAGAVEWPTFESVARTVVDARERLVIDSLVHRLETAALCFPDRGRAFDLAREVLERQSRRLGLSHREGEPSGDAVAREMVQAVRVRVDGAFARELADRFPALDPLEPELRTPVAIAHARVGGAATYRTLRTELARARSEADAVRLERALVWTRDPALVGETLDLALTGGINRGHVPAVIVHAAANPEGRATTARWLDGNLPRLNELFRGTGFLSFLLERALPLVGLGRSEEVREYFRTHSFPEGTQGVAKGLERLAILESLGRRLPAG